MRSRRPTCAWPALTLSLAIALAACGGDAATAVPSTPPSSPSGSDSGSLEAVDDGPRYVFNVLTGDGGGLVTTRLDGSDEQRLAQDVPGVLKRDDWSPDGQSVALVEEQSETVWIAHLDGSPSEQLPMCKGDGCDYPAFSPDGTKVAFSRAEAGPAGPAAVSIQVLDLPSGDVQTVVRLARPLLADVPRWSPDGKNLVIGVDRMDSAGNETGSAIAVVPTTGGKVRYLTDFKDFAYYPDWNSATDMIVFGPATREFQADVDMAAETWDIWVIKPDGSGLRRVAEAHHGEQFRGAKWTPDGTAILAWSSRVGAVRIDPASGSIEPIDAPAHTGAPRQRPVSP